MHLHALLQPLFRVCLCMLVYTTHMCMPVAVVRATLHNRQNSCLSCKRCMHTSYPLQSTGAISCAPVSVLEGTLLLHVVGFMVSFECAPQRGSVHVHIVHAPVVKLLQRERLQLLGYKCSCMVLQQVLLAGFMASSHLASPHFQLASKQDHALLVQTLHHLDERQRLGRSLHATYKAGCFILTATRASLRVVAACSQRWLWKLSTFSLVLSIHNTHVSARRVLSPTSPALQIKSS